MQSNQLIAMNNANIEHYPHPYPGFKPDPSNQITIGDLHANAIKLLHFLVFQNVLVITPEDYTALVKIYSSYENSEADYKTFSDILERTTVQPVGVVRLIGDELADRGKNDYFILKIIEKLSTNKVRIEILYSNHGAEFYAAFTNNTHIVLPQGDFQRKSLNQLQYLIEEKTIDKNEVIKIVDKHYLPNVKLISYSIDETTAPPTLTFYTHAAAGLETIIALAKLYNVTYHDQSLELLCSTIDQINIEFKKSNPTARLKYEYAILSQGNWTGLQEVSALYPLMRITWSRSISYNFKLPKTQNGYALRLVHGHEGTFASIHRSNNVTCLDVSNLGKISNKPDFYYSLYSQDKLSIRKSIAETQSDQEPTLLNDIMSIKFWDENSETKIISPTSLTTKNKTTPTEPEIKKSLKPIEPEIPFTWWDQKQHPVIQEKIKNTVSILKQYVEKCEKPRLIPWFSLFRSSSSSGAEKLANELEKKSDQDYSESDRVFDYSEIRALKSEPLGEIIKDLAKDDLLPKQFC